jgi:hypothetical protein
MYTLLGLGRMHGSYLGIVVGQDGLDVEQNLLHTDRCCGDAIVDGLESVEAKAVEAGELAFGEELLTLGGIGYELDL